MAIQRLTKEQVHAMTRDLLGDSIAKALRPLTQMKSLAMQTMLANTQDARDKGKSDPLGGFILALANTKGDVLGATKWAEERYGDDSIITKALGTISPSAGSVLVPETLAPYIIDLLTADAVMRKMGAQVIPLVNGQMDIPRLDGGITATYFSEGSNIGTTQPSLGQVHLQAHDMGAIVVLNNNLLRRAGYNVEQLVRNNVVTQMALKEDLTFIQGDGTLATPVGLRYQVPPANRIAMTGTPTAATARIDLGRMITLLQNANVKMRKAAWIMRPEVKEWLASITGATGDNLAFPTVANENTLRGFPIAVSSQISVDVAGPPTQSYVYLADFSHLLVADAGTLEIDASNSAAYDLNGVVQAAFSRNQTVLRAISSNDFGMEHAGAACALTGCTWGG